MYVCVRLIQSPTAINCFLVSDASIMQKSWNDRQASSRSESCQSNVRWTVKLVSFYAAHGGWLSKHTRSCAILRWHLLLLPWIVGWRIISLNVNEPQQHAFAARTHTQPQLCTNHHPTLIHIHIHMYVYISLHKSCVLERIRVADKCEAVSEFKFNSHTHKHPHTHTYKYAH